MLQRITRFAFGVNDDHVGLQLVDAFGQKSVAGQHRHQVVAALQEANAQAARALGL